MKVVYPGYPLRPEIIESAFYLDRFTKDPRYVAMGKTFFDCAPHIHAHRRRLHDAEERRHERKGRSDAELLPHGDAEVSLPALLNRQDVRSRSCRLQH